MRVSRVFVEVILAIQNRSEGAPRRTGSISVPATGSITASAGRRSSSFAAATSPRKGKISGVQRSTGPITKSGQSRRRTGRPRVPTYKEDLIAELRDSADYAAQYLSAAAADSTDALLVALRDVVIAREGMTEVAKTAKVNRVNLYKMLSENGNPGLRNLGAVLGALRIGVRFVNEGEASTGLKRRATDSGVESRRTEC